MAMKILIIRKLIGSIYLFGLVAFFALAYYAWANGFSLELDDPAALLPGWFMRILVLTWFLSWLVHGGYMVATGRWNFWFDATGLISYFMLVSAIPGGIPHITPNLQWTTLAGMYLVYLIPAMQFMDFVLQMVDWLASPTPAEPALQPEP